MAATPATIRANEVGRQRQVAGAQAFLGQYQDFTQLILVDAR